MSDWSRSAAHSGPAGEHTYTHTPSGIEVRKVASLFGLNHWTAFDPKGDDPAARLTPYRKHLADAKADVARLVTARLT